MIFRGFENVSTSLISQLQQLKGLKVTAIERRTQTFPLINNAHVVICDPANIPENFPWSSFASFIAYEDKIEYLSKVLFGKSVQGNNFICLKGVSSGDQQELDGYNIESMSLQYINKLRLIWSMGGSHSSTRRHQSMETPSELLPDVTVLVL